MQIRCVALDLGSWEELGQCVNFFMQEIQII